MKNAHFVVFILVVVISAITTPCCAQEVKKQEQTESVLEKQLTEQKEQLKKEQERKEKALADEERAKKEMDNYSNLALHASTEQQRTQYREQEEALGGQIVELESDSKNIEREIQKIEDTIKTLTQQLNTLYQNQVLLDPFAKQFENALSEKIDRTGAIDTTVFEGFLSDEFDRALLQSTPKAELAALLSLQDRLVKSATVLDITSKDKSAQSAVNALTQKIGKRIDILEEFISNPPHAPTTKMGKALNLDKKIVADQVQAISSERNKIVAGLEQHIKNKDLVGVGKSLDDLRELIKAGQEYNLFIQHPEIENMIAAIIRSQEQEQRIAPQLPPEQVGIYLQAYDAVADKLVALKAAVIKFAMEKFLDGSLVGADKIAGLIMNDPAISIQQVLQDNPALLRQMIKAIEEKKVLEYSKKAATEMSNVARDMSAFESNAPWIESLLKKIDSVVRKIKTGAGYIPFVGNYIAGKLESVSDGIQKALTTIGKVSIAAPYIIKSATILGPIVVDNAQLYSEKILPILKAIESRLPKDPSVQERADVALDLDKAAALTAQEKEIVPDKYRDVFSPLRDVSKNVIDWFKPIFETAQRNINATMSAYTKARQDYLQALGFTQEELKTPLSQEQVKKKILLAQLVEDPDALKAASDAYAQALLALTRVYADYTEQLNGLVSYYEFISKAWDTAYIVAPETFSEAVQSILDLRDMRVAYLDSLQRGVDVIGKNVAEITQGSQLAPITKLSIDRISTMLSTELIDSISLYQMVLSTLDTQIANQRNELSSYLKGQGQSDAPPGYRKR
jgi:hypothetical protein